MIKNFFLLILLLFSTFFSAQNHTDKKYLLSTKTTTYGLSTIRLTDPYLSPLSYSGIGLRSEFESKRFLNPDNINISRQSKFGLFAAIALNPTSTASMIYAGFNYDWGLHYHFRPMEGLQLLAGGVCDFDFG